ncbi:pyridoxamine 5'-phosphate oxidase family protein [Bradyrhizobium sp. CCGE-LA001]|uniref:pyridoxamine 5'-phosphate oxidase family protein n=1 Tax=Bradyrhizobium sp. CCGE-LA001 TaxID=1223566 RepID=UPI0002AABCB3|nr:pyridoxamine 5'-phosphate oxidase family protein [Bradyrhizobium sp. CCGE-LA001]AMA57805.1 pyridoxamine 5'-phosphate oxidase [Bradyrhizobium sp. CCGE-LA001]
MSMRFDEVIATQERLRELSDLPSFRARNKVIDHVDEICRRFIAACPFVLVASRGADGHIDVSPKGDPAGFVAVLDDRTLAIPDRRGNNRLDTFENLLVHPEIGLLFMIPGHGDTLRISGTGTIVRDGALQARLAVEGKPPNLILVIEINEVFLHCPKCVVRSKLWSPEHWPNRSSLPSLAHAIVTHARSGETEAEVQAVIDHGIANLY